MKKLVKITDCLLLFSLFFCNFTALSAGNRPEEMKTLADMLRGTWAGKIEQQENKTLEMWGNWILDGHFVELVLMTKEKGNTLYIEKFIFGWKKAAQVYSCRYFNSSGESRTSSWSKKGTAAIVQSNNADHFLKLQHQGGKLLFCFNGRKMVLFLKNR
ncbi:MAG: hypothetical protein KAW12_27265 [Candidatus Aminicenantes bacterium]|nr:hypothetical protein [Candidatus Aminicenantes bacterium]